jgi:biotin transport system substrate-specific component
MSPVQTGTILSHSTAGSASAAAVRVMAVLLAVALTAASAQVTMPVPFTDVPFALTPMMVILSGAVLGSRLGFVALLSYLAAGIAGLPVFAPSVALPPGALRLLGGTGGYLMAYPLAAFVTGWLAERGWDRRYLTSLAAMLAGLAVIYAGGAAWRTGLLGSFDLAIVTGVLPFIVPDLLKAALAALILPQAWKLMKTPHLS